MLQNVQLSVDMTLQVQSSTLTSWDRLQLKHTQNILSNYFAVIMYKIFVKHK